MDFFRKHFINILVGILILVTLASVLPRFFSNDESLPQQVAVSNEIKEYIPPFEHEGNLSFYRKDSTLIKTFSIEFARTERETELGLMYRKSMNENEGMLFVFHDEKPRSFWMKNTYIPLDIIYLNKDKIEQNILKIVINNEPLNKSQMENLKKIVEHATEDEIKVEAVILK